jgi:2-amino-4-hydroxy-6-hydroxymethyldihydropteridine diphosphokinase
MSNAIAYLGLGANLGDAKATIARAIEMIAGLPGTRVLARARLYRTKPVGPPGQPDYANTAVKIATGLSPRALLDAVKGIERALGRVPSERWGPRVIDVDLLLFGESSVAEPELTIPHAELANRRFVLAPLFDLAPELVVPGLGKNVRALLGALGGDPGDAVPEA